MTRNSDVSPAPDARRHGNSVGAIFVCIHFNSSTPQGANGIETISIGRQRRALRQYPSEASSGRTHGNRGIRRRAFWVLQGQHSIRPRRMWLPSNPYEADLIQTASYREKLAQEIAREFRRQPHHSSVDFESFRCGLVGPQPFNSQEMYGTSCEPTPSVSAQVTTRDPRRNARPQNRRAHDNKENHNNKVGGMI
jgi:hypothetical protein